MTVQPGDGPASSGSGEPPKVTRGDLTEMIVCVLAAAAFTYLLVRPLPDRPLWQTIGLFLMLGVAVSRVVAYLGKRRRK